jgi:hypothetical protein
MGDLHMIDVVSVPQRLEHQIRKAEHQDVLHRSLAEIVINPIDLVLTEMAQQTLLQHPGAHQVISERLFDDHAPPVA